MNDIKLCPFCAEEIKEAAIVCKHCGRDLLNFTNESKEYLKVKSEQAEGIQKNKKQEEFGEITGYGIKYDMRDDYLSAEYGCADCGGIVDITDALCKGCGKKFTVEKPK